MLYPLDDTIAAIASAPGGGPRGIVRISGPATSDCLHALLPSTDLLSPRRPSALAVDLELAPLGTLPADVYFWPSTRSYTGQPAAEIHTLGSPPSPGTPARNPLRRGNTPRRTGRIHAQGIPLWTNRSYPGRRSSGGGRCRGHRSARCRPGSIGWRTGCPATQLARDAPGTARPPGSRLRLRR